MTPGLLAVPSYPCIFLGKTSLVDILCAGQAFRASANDSKGRRCSELVTVTSVIIRDGALATGGSTATRKQLVYTCARTTKIMENLNIYIN